MVDYVSNTEGSVQVHDDRRPGVRTDVIQEHASKLPAGVLGKPTPAQLVVLDAVSKEEVFSTAFGYTLAGAFVPEKRVVGLVDKGWLELKEGAVKITPLGSAALAYGVA